MIYENPDAVILPDGRHSHPSINIYIGWLERYPNIEEAKRAAEAAGFAPDDPQWEIALKAMLERLGAEGKPS
jgi:hypothetical protein